MTLDDPLTVTFYEEVAEQVLALRVGIVVNPESIAPSEVLASEAFTGLPVDVWNRIVQELSADPSRWGPFLRQAIERKIAERCIGRMHDALSRYATLQPILIRRMTPAKADPYVKELIDTYMLGFDAAAIALACSVFEQLAKSALVAIGATTERQIKKDRPAAEKLLSELRRANLLPASAESARKLIDRRNAVLHRFYRLLPLLSPTRIRMINRHARVMLLASVAGWGAAAHAQSAVRGLSGDVRRTFQRTRTGLEGTSPSPLTHRLSAT